MIKDREIQTMRTENKNFVPPFSDSHRSLLLSSRQAVELFSFREEEKMVKHYVPVWQDGQAWVLWRQVPELGNDSPTKRVQHFKSYLKASLVAYQENCRLTKVEAEHKELFAGAKQ